ncbi:MAG: DMT family transporter [Rhodospirillales bacterium]
MNAIRSAVARFEALPANVRAIVWAVVSTAVFAIVPIGVRMASESVPTVEIVCLRGFLACLILLPFFAVSGFRGIGTRHTGQYLTRSFMQGTGMVMWFWAMTQIALDQAVALHFTLPLFAIVLAVFLLKERLTMSRVVATIVGFAGVVIILRPGATEVGLPALAVLGSAALYAASMIMTKVLTRTDSPAAVILHQHLWLGLLTLAPTVYYWQTPDWRGLQGLLIIGVAGTIAPYLFTRGLRIADASLVISLDFLRLPFNAMVGFFLYDEIPDEWAFVGGAVIFGATYYNTMRESRAGRPPAKGS